MAAPRSALRTLLTCAVFSLGVAIGTPSLGAAPLSFSQAMTGQRSGERTEAPVIGRYQTDEGGVFVLDRSSPRPLLKFGDNPEIWVLQPARGPRGDTIYRNDLGEEMLRATRMGGMTVFTETRPDGSAAALDGASSPLKIASLSSEALYARLFQAMVRTSRAAQHQIGFAAGKDPDPTTSALIADTAMVVSQALIEMASRPALKGLVTRITDVSIVAGPKPAVTLQRGVLLVTIAPSEGIAGRPSSRWIEKAAGAK